MVSRPVLDPRHPVSATKASFFQLPINARAFGFVPDVKALQLGDAILFAKVAPNLVGRQIEWLQRNGGLDASDAQWTHVAVYIGDGYIVEAVPWHGVRVSSLYLSVPSHCLLVRRAPGLSDTMRFKIVISAMTRISRAYSFAILPRLIAAAIAGFWKPTIGVRLSRALVCSTLYYDSFVEATQSTACDSTGDPWPAHLSGSNRLQDITVPWIEVEKLI